MSRKKGEVEETFDYEALIQFAQLEAGHSKSFTSNK